MTNSTSSNTPAVAAARRRAYGMRTAAKAREASQQRRIDEWREGKKKAAVQAKIDKWVQGKIAEKKAIAKANRIAAYYAGKGKKAS